MVVRWLPFSLVPLALALALACSPAQLVGPPPPDDASVTDGPGPPPDDGSLPTTTSVSIIVEPSDKGAGILAAINAAKKSIHITMYLFTNDTLADAVIAQHKAGRDVKIILNQNCPSAGADNAQEYAKFKTAGIPGVRLHDLRHTAASVAVGQGASLALIGRLLGHSQTQTTHRYAHVDIDPAIGVANAIGDAISGAIRAR